MTPFLPTVEEFKLQVVEAWSISQVDSVAIMTVLLCPFLSAIPVLYHSSNVGLTQKPNTPLNLPQDKTFGQIDRSLINYLIYLFIILKVSAFRG